MGPVHLLVENGFPGHVLVTGIAFEGLQPSQRLAALDPARLALDQERDLEIDEAPGSVFPWRDLAKTIALLGQQLSGEPREDQGQRGVALGC